MRIFGKASSVRAGSPFKQAICTETGCWAAVSKAYVYVRSVYSKGRAGKKNVVVDWPGTVNEGMGLRERSTRAPLESRMVR